MGTLIDVRGQIFHNIKVLERVPHRGWKCQCLDCGKITYRSLAQLRNNGCTCRIRNTINERYFEQIDTSEKAYYFGFLWADGTVNLKTKKVKLDVQESDKDILEKMKKDFDFSGNITSYIARKGQSYRPKDATVYRLAIVNLSFAQSLVEKGLDAHRECTDFPKDFVPFALMWDFIRGYFDGNGCISFTREGRCLAPVTITGGTKVIQAIGDFCEKQGLEISYAARRQTNLNNLTLRLTKREYQLKFLKALYENSSRHLERKFQKFLKCLSLF